MAVGSAQQSNPVAHSAVETSVENGRLERYLPLVRSRANAFRQKGIETDDLVQEGVIGLLYAIRAYDHRPGVSFETFAYVCITNRLRSAVAAVGRKPDTVSLDGCLSLGETLHHLAQEEEDPQEIVISRERFDQWLQRVAARLSGFEHQVIRYYLGGYSYQEMAQLLQSTTKAVDNALQRARRKLRRL